MRVFALLVAVLLAVSAVHAQSGSGEPSTTPAPYNGTYYSVIIYTFIEDAPNIELDFVALLELHQSLNYQPYTPESYLITPILQKNVNQTHLGGRIDRLITWRVWYIQGYEKAKNFSDGLRSTFIPNPTWFGFWTTKNITTVVGSEPLWSSNTSNTCDDYFFDGPGSPCLDNHLCGINDFMGSECCHYALYYCNTIRGVFDTDPRFLPEVVQTCNRLQSNYKFFLDCTMPAFHESMDVNIWPNNTITRFYSMGQLEGLLAGLTEQQLNVVELVAQSFGLFEAINFMLAYYNQYNSAASSDGSSSSSSAPSTTAIVLLAVGSAILVAVVAFAAGRRQARRNREAANSVVAEQVNEPVEPAKNPTPVWMEETDA